MPHANQALSPKPAIQDRRARRALACLALLGVVAGCGNGFKLTGVTVSLVDFKPAASALLESSAVLTVRYSNENVIPIGVSGSTHKIYLNGTYIGKAMSQEPIGLAALSSITQDVTVRFENLALIQQLVGLRDRQLHDAGWPRCARPASQHRWS